MIEKAAEILDVKIDDLNKFSVVDTFNNNNVLEGFICRKSDHRYGTLVIFKINDEATEQIIWATPKLDYPFDKSGNYHWPNVLKQESYEKLDGCLEKNTKIITLEFGPMPIWDIVENKISCSVKSINFDTNKIIFDKVIGYSLFINNNSWLEIEIEDGKTLTVTEEHYIWLPLLKCWRKAKDLKEFDEILIG